MMVLPLFVQTETYTDAQRKELESLIFQSYLQATREAGPIILADAMKGKTQHFLAVAAGGMFANESAIHAAMDGLNEKLSQADIVAEVERWLRLPDESRFLIMARIIGMLEATRRLVQEVDR